METLQVSVVLVYAETLQPRQMDALQVSVLAVNADAAQQRLPQKYDMPCDKSCYVKHSHKHSHVVNKKQKNAQAHR